MSEQRRVLSEWRKEREMTQFQLAVQSGASLSTIASIESKRQNVSITVAEKIAAALGITTADILWPTEDEVKANKRSKEAA